MLTCGGIGSSIIVTTRLESVASMTSTVPIFRLEILPEEKCWSLFKHYAVEENEKYHPMLEKIGKEIVKKCGGVPLAAKALGGLLRYKKGENEWLLVRDSSLWNLPQDKNDAILPALRLSYIHLPSHLKQCFSYCSIFPKDYEMVRDDLIHLWMANGFFQSRGTMELEDIGKEIFNELLWRSLLQDIRKDNYNNKVYCKMHDLVHDLACSITRNECAVVKVDNGQNVFKGITRHLLLEAGSSSSSRNISNSILSQSQPLLRTFLLIGPMRTTWKIQEITTYSNLECLRVLDLSLINMRTLHVSIRNLKHLRYLDLSRCWDMISLPDESICSLRNLQVLKLDYCYNLQVLPENMRKLTNLRHLMIQGCNKLRRMPVGMGNLSCLRTLSMFVVDPQAGRGITELQGLGHLTGKLRIHGLEHVRNSKDAKCANLMRIKNISDLSLLWSKENNSTIEEDEEVASIGESLQPHSKLKQLNIIFYNGLKFPSWMSHLCLPNLVEIRIEGWRRCENLPSLGNLPLLESLWISGMDSLKCIGDEFYGDHRVDLFFPALKKLAIYKMQNLEDWSSSSTTEDLEVVFPSLEVLILDGCPKLRTLPSLSSSLKDLHLNECNEMILESLLENDIREIIDDDILGERRRPMMLRKLACSWCKMKILPKELLESLPKLSDLSIEFCKELVCLPEEMQKLTSLKSFHIAGCRNLKSLPELGNINNTVMTRLSIQHCVGLTSVSDCLRHLTTLEDLVINGYPELEFLQGDFQDLTSLRYLEIMCLLQMTCLPEGLQQVAGTLERLTISRCPKMTSLPEWMCKFTSLRRLFIHGCKNLKALPEEVLHLTALESVTIQDCHPDMHRRYAKETGEDWHKIAHIPDLSITESTWRKSSRHGG